MKVYIGRNQNDIHFGCITNNSMSKYINSDFIKDIKDLFEIELTSEQMFELLDYGYIVDKNNIMRCPSGLSISCIPIEIISIKTTEQRKMNVKNKLISFGFTLDDIENLILLIKEGS